MGGCVSTVETVTETEDSLRGMTIPALGRRALRLGVLKSTVAAALHGPPSRFQKANLIEIILQKQSQRRSEAENAFRAVDTKGRGYLNMAGIRASFLRLGATLSPAQVDIFMAAIDADQSGKVSLGEWLEYWALPEAQRQGIAFVEPCGSPDSPTLPERDTPSRDKREEYEDPQGSMACDPLDSTVTELMALIERDERADQIPATMRIGDLRARAKAQGVTNDKIAAAEDGMNPMEDLVALIAQIKAEAAINETHTADHAVTMHPAAPVDLPLQSPIDPIFTTMPSTTDTPKCLVQNNLSLPTEVFIKGSNGFGIKVSKSFQLVEVPRFQEHAEGGYIVSVDGEHHIDLQRLLSRLRSAAEGTAITVELSRQPICMGEGEMRRKFQRSTVLGGVGCIDMGCMDGPPREWHDRAQIRHMSTRIEGIRQAAARVPPSDEDVGPPLKMVWTEADGLIADAFLDGIESGNEELESQVQQRVTKAEEASFIQMWVHSQEEARRNAATEKRLAEEESRRKAAERVLLWAQQRKLEASQATGNFALPRWTYTPLDISTSANSLETEIDLKQPTQTQDTGQEAAVGPILGNLFAQLEDVESVVEASWHDVENLVVAFKSEEDRDEVPFSAPSPWPEDRSLCTEVFIKGSNGFGIKVSKSFQLVEVPRFQEHAEGGYIVSVDGEHHIDLQRLLSRLRSAAEGTAITVELSRQPICMGEGEMLWRFKRSTVLGKMGCITCCHACTTVHPVGWAAGPPREWHDRAQLRHMSTRIDKLRKEDARRSDESVGPPLKMVWTEADELIANSLLGGIESADEAKKPGERFWEARKAKASFRVAQDVVRVAVSNAVAAVEQRVAADKQRLAEEEARHKAVFDQHVEEEESRRKAAAQVASWAQQAQQRQRRVPSQHITTYRESQPILGDFFSLVHDLDYMADAVIRAKDVLLEEVRCQKQYLEAGQEQELSLSDECSEGSSEESEEEEAGPEKRSLFDLLVWARHRQRHASQPEEEEEEEEEQEEQEEEVQNLLPAHSVLDELFTQMYDISDLVEAFNVYSLPDEFKPPQAVTAPEEALAIEIEQSAKLHAGPERQHKKEKRKHRKNQKEQTQNDDLKIDDGPELELVPVQELEPEPEPEEQPWQIVPSREQNSLAPEIPADSICDTEHQMAQPPQSNEPDIEKRHNDTTREVEDAARTTQKRWRKRVEDAAEMQQAVVEEQALREELCVLRLSALQKYARRVTSVHEDELEAALDAEQPREALLSLILDKLLPPIRTGAVARRKHRLEEARQNKLDALVAQQEQQQKENEAAAAAAEETRQASLVFGGLFSQVGEIDEMVDAIRVHGTEEDVVPLPVAKALPTAAEKLQHQRVAVAQIVLWQQAQQRRTTTILASKLKVQIARLTHTYENKRSILERHLTQLAPERYYDTKLAEDTTHNAPGFNDPDRIAIRKQLYH